MRRALMLAALTALAVARPESYKEKEDFQYSRSSSDDGTKSGFYGAQRGNMGGNYERAHNMDSLAQHQMGGLVRNVEGELGDGAQQKSGSVYSAARSSGVYGASHYDLSNLAGRNFQEGTSFGDSSSHSSHNAGYGGRTYSASGAYGSNSHNSKYSGYRTSGTSDQTQSQFNTHQSADSLQSSGLYDESQASQAALNSGYSSQTGYRAISGYDQAAANSHLTNGYGSQIRLVSAQPVKVYVRPGGSVAVPIAAQTVDSSHGSASTFDQNAINSEADVLTSSGQHAVYKPTSNAKHYESSYRYRKEWEKHDTIPVGSVVVPTENPYPVNSELNEDIQSQGSEHQHEATGQASRNAYTNQYRGYNVKSGSSSQSRHESAYSGQQHRSTSEAASNVAGSNAYTYGAYGNNGATANLHAGSLNNQVEDIASKPKSYQSSYSYHKSWERQGDPYIIKPSTSSSSTDAQASQRLTASSLTQGSSGSQSHQYGSNYHQGYNGIDCDCDENGHIRVARSYNSGQDQVSYQQSQDDIQDQQQSENLESFGQQPQHLEDFGQQSQNLEDLGQQSQNLEDLSQQSQKLENLGQQSQNLEDFGQQSQNLEEFGQQSQNLEDLGQQTQNFGQESQNLETLGQQTQNQWEQQSQMDLEQEQQNTWSALETIQNAGKDTEQQVTGIRYTHPPSSGAFQPEENAFANSHPSNIDNLNRPQSHTTLDDRNQPNPLANPVFDIHRQETAGTESDFTHSEGTAQHTHYWHSVQPNNPNVQPSMPHFNYNTFQHNEADMQEYLDMYRRQLNMGYGNNQQTQYSSNVGYTNPWMYNSMYDMPNTNVHQNGYGVYGQPVNTYTNTQTQVNRHDHSSHSYTNIEAPAQESGPLNNLWDILDNIEKETTSRDDKDSFDFNHSYQVNNEQGQASNFDRTQNTNEHKFNYEGKPVGLAPVLSSTTERPHIETTTNMHKQPREQERGDIGPEKKLRPTEDIGRGDIGPDDSSSGTSNAPVEALDNILEQKPVPTNNKPIHEYKTPEEIETLSLTKESNKTASVFGLDTYQQKQNNDQFENNLSVLSISEQKQHALHNEQRSSSTTPKNNYMNPTNFESGSPDIEQQSADHHFQKPEQEIESQQSFNPLQTVDQQNVHLNQENIHEHDRFNLEQGPDDIQQQNVGHQIVDFSQQSEVMGQQLEIFDQQNVNLNQENIHEHDRFNLEQGPDDIQQHNVGHQIVDFSQQSQDMGKQIESFNQQNVNLNQENIHEHNGFNLEQGPDDIQQQNMEQQFENFGQQSENLNQETFNKFEELGQQSESLGQEQLENFHHENINNYEQQENFQQESLTAFNQQNETLNDAQNEQQLENWDQQNADLEQQSQVENLNQQVQIQEKPAEEPHYLRRAFASPSAYQKEGREQQNQEPVTEPEIQKVTQNSAVQSPPEPVTEKAGFWNKVGSKFVSAKDKVASWFSKSS